MIRSFALKKEVIRTNSQFSPCFYSFLLFFLFLSSRANRSHRSALCRSLQKSKIGIHSLEKSESLFRSFAHKNERISYKTVTKITNSVLLPILELQNKVLKVVNKRKSFLQVKTSNFRFKYFRRIEATLENTSACQSCAQMGQLSKELAKNRWTLSL